MWVLLSTRIRTWLLLAIAVPVARKAVRYVARRVERGHPDTPTAKALRTADSALARIDRRRRKRARTGHDD